MFKIKLFYPIEYRRRIRNCMTLKMKVKVIWNQWHLKTIEWAISDSIWICESNRRSICNFTLPWLYLPLPICINCRALAWEGVYVYKLAFFFWLSPRTYHFLFEKRLVIDWRYFWRNIALSLILERSPGYPLNHTSRVAVGTRTDHPKSVRNRCVIEFFVAFWCRLLVEHSVGIRAFVIGLSHISFFSSSCSRIDATYMTLCKTFDIFHII